MDPLLHIRDEGTVKTMDFIGRISSEEGEDRKVGRKSDSHSFLRYMRYNSYRLSSVEANDQWRLLCSLIGPFQQHFKEKNVLIWRRRKCSSVKTMHGFISDGIDGQIQRIPLRIASPSSIFILASYDYFLFPNLKK